MSEKIGTESAQRDKNGRFVLGNSGGTGRPKGTTKDAITKVEIIGQDGLTLSAHGLMGAFDGFMTEEKWVECIESMFNSAVNKGSHNAFERLWKMKERLMVLTGSQELDMVRLLDAFNNYVELQESDNSNISDTGSDPS